MNKFESVILFNPDLTNPAILKEEDIFKKNIQDSGGKIISGEDWGLRDLSFNINNYKKSFYKYYQLEIDGNKIQNIKKSLTQNEKILRHLFIKTSEQQSLPTNLSKDEEK